MGQGLMRDAAQSGCSESVPIAQPSVIDLKKDQFCASLQRF
jgi:hypothetical protein